MPESKSKRSRYTPPPPKKAPPSKLWVPVAITTLLAVGLIVIVTNYLNLLPGSDVQNRYLLLGIALISGGFMLATNYR
ncbi:MAG TPA: cell division protein CrgA [Acidimicrobiia bacterium]|nr:cell division protein CrgA [Acidimicrobiia bacterium]